MNYFLNLVAISMLTGVGECMPQKRAGTSKGAVGKPAAGTFTAKQIENRRKFNDDVKKKLKKFLEEEIRSDQFFTPNRNNIKSDMEYLIDRIHDEGWGMYNVVCDNNYGYPVIFTPETKKFELTGTVRVDKRLDMNPTATCVAFQNKLDVLKRGDGGYKNWGWKGHCTKSASNPQSISCQAIDFWGNAVN